MYKLSNTSMGQSKIKKIWITNFVNLSLEFVYEDIEILSLLQKSILGHYSINKIEVKKEQFDICTIKFSLYHIRKDYESSQSGVLIKRLESFSKISKKE